MANLPAGFQITSIEGLRCTAVPRTLTTLTGSLALQAATFTTSSSLPTTTADSIAASTSTAQNDSPQAVPAAPSTTFASAVAPATTLASVVATPTTSPTPIVTSTSAVVFISTSTTSRIAISSSITSTSASSSARLASNGNTPFTPSTFLSTAPAAAAQGPISSSLTTLIPAINMNGATTLTPTFTSFTPDWVGTNTDPEASAATSGLSSSNQASIAPVIGGVIGSVALIGLVGLLIFLFRRRRRRESLLTPLTTGRSNSFYDSDAASVGPSGRGARWKNNIGHQADRIKNIGSGIKTGLAGLGASVKSRVGGARSNSPSVDLNRGNSQFLDGPIPQHSRNNSILSNSGDKVTIKDRATNWLERLKKGFGKKTEEQDPFADARGMTEKQVRANGTPDFSQLLGANDRDLQLQADRRRASFAEPPNSLPQIGSLGLGFGSGDDPFADPIKAIAAGGVDNSQPWKPSNPNPSANPFVDPPPARSNPFADPIPRMEPSLSKTSNYVSDVRRSRGQSIDQTNKTFEPTSLYRQPSTAVGSRYPSTMAPDRDSYRDTVFSTFSTNVRKGKGRSDPFDLERPELLSSRENSQNLYPDSLHPNKPATNMNPLRMSSPKNGASSGSAVASGKKGSRITSTTSYASKYSSGVSSLGDWGGPGPDLGPASGSSSMRGNASTDGASIDYSREAATSGRSIGGSGTRDDITNMLEARRKADNVSPLSSGGSVGKAM